MVDVVDAGGVGVSASCEGNLGGEIGGGRLCGGIVEQDGGGVAEVFATAKSSFPSPLRSPMLTAPGARASREVNFGGKGGGGGLRW